MIEIPTTLGSARIVESIDELPTFPGGIHKLYADVETTSMGLHEDIAVHPYLGDRACGWAVTVDDIEGAWYVPIRHKHGNNLPLDHVILWLRDLLERAYEWDNANIKFDAHFAHVDGADFKCRLGCTTTRAKLLDSDRFSHGLKQLTRDWLGIKTDEADEVAAYLDGIKTKGSRKKCKDYGRVPIDILGKYACFDVLSNRKLDNYILDSLPAEQSQLLETETLLTPVLWDMENEGLRIDVRATQFEELRCLEAMLKCSQYVFDKLGQELVDSNNCMTDLLINQLGLPILAWGKKRQDGTRGPSFDKDAMKLYSGHPLVVTDERINGVVQAICEFRTQSRFRSLYCKSFMEKKDENDFVHPTINQCVRTGRMSASDPNEQQLNKRAKALIIPDEGFGMLSNDASQAEFRMIAHITKDDDAIKAYSENPKTDYHVWVAELCGIARQPAKTMNFLMAFGGGKKKATNELMSLKDILDEVVPEIDERIEVGKLDPDTRTLAIERSCAHRAKEIFETYHITLPGIKIMSKRCEKLTKARGYIRNPYKRRRHLDPQGAYKAFNTVNQSGVSDYVKERMVFLAHRYNAHLRELNLHIRAAVHDEVKQQGPIEVVKDPEVMWYVKQNLEQPAIEFRVPFYWDQGYSSRNWREATENQSIQKRLAQQVIHGTL